MTSTKSLSTATQASSWAIPVGSSTQRKAKKEKEMAHKRKNKQQNQGKKVMRRRLKRAIRVWMRKSKCLQSS